MNTKTDLRVVRTQKHLRRALYDLLAEQDVQEITVKRLTERAEVSRGTFYLYFDSIQSMIDAYNYELYEAFHKNVVNILDMKLDFKSTCVRILCNPFTDEEDMYAFNKLLIGRRIGTKTIISAVESIKDEFLKVFKIDNDDRFLDYAFEFIAGGISATLSLWTSEADASRTFEDFTELIINILMKSGTRFDAVKRY